MMPPAQARCARAAQYFSDDFSIYEIRFRIFQGDFPHPETRLPPLPLFRPTHGDSPEWAILEPREFV